MEEKTITKGEENAIEIVEKALDLCYKNRKGESENHRLDYEEAGRMYRYWDQSKFTMFSILFSAIIIILSYEISNYSAFTLQTAILTSLLSIVLVIGWVILHKRLVVGVHVNGIYMKAMEKVIFNDVNNRRFSHIYSCWALRGKKDKPNIYKVDALGVYSAIVSLVVTTSLWLIIGKCLPSIDWYHGSDVFISIFITILIFLTGIAIVLLYNWYNQDIPSERYFEKYYKRYVEKMEEKI